LENLEHQEAVGCLALMALLALKVKWVTGEK
jgi:hypothetical protein